MSFLKFKKSKVKDKQFPVEEPTVSPANASIALQRQGSGIAAAVQERLAAEVLRKLKLATNAEEKEDRDIVCSEVFADITGELNTAARDSTGAIYKRWYEVLAPYFCVATDSSESLLTVCRQLWGQPFTAPIFTLLLHQWLLVHPSAGGVDERLKHLNILVSGCRQLFIGDIETGVTAFRPLFSFITEQVVMANTSSRRLDDLPGPAREALLSLTASFMPYYASPMEFAHALEIFPPQHHSNPSSNNQNTDPNTHMNGHMSEQHQTSFAPGDGADFLIDKVVEFLNREVRSEPAVIKYLRAIVAIRTSPYTPILRTSTKVRLQGEIYALTQPGGPRYASRTVNKVAFEALDAIFPHGRRTRRMINVAFRFLHPQEWPWVWWDACVGFWMGFVVCYILYVKNIVFGCISRGVSLLQNRGVGRKKRDIGIQKKKEET